MSGVVPGNFSGAGFGIPGSFQPVSSGDFVPLGPNSQPPPDLSSLFGESLSDPKPPNQTLVYSPDVRIIIGHNATQFDISADIVRGTVLRKENSASTLLWECHNKDLRYTARKIGAPRFSRMDRVTCYMKRAGNWIQVFSGYLDSVPYMQLYPGIVSFKATCTLKRLLCYWWNPSLNDSALIMNQYLTPESAVAGSGHGGAGGTPKDNAQGTSGYGDSRLGSILFQLLTTVGGWDPATVHIQNFPSGFMDLLQAQLQHQQANVGQALNFQRYLQGDNAPPPLGMANYNSGAGTPGPTVVPAGFGPGTPGGLPPTGAAGSHTVFYVKEIVAACDQLGMGPNTTSTTFSTGMQQSDTTGETSRDTATRTAFQQSQNVAKNYQTAVTKQDAAILGVATAMVETGGGVQINNLANVNNAESMNMPNDGSGHDSTSCGIFQQIDTGWGCLPADAQIFTSIGPVRIVDVRVGDEVWSFDGAKMALAKVTDRIMTGYRPLLTIRTAGRELKVTANHRIPVRRYFGVADGRRYGNQHQQSTCEWKTIEVYAGHIRRGDYLIVPHGMGDGTVRMTPDGQDLTVGLMELIGLYLGDGNCDKGRVEIAHGHGIDEDHMPYYRAVIEDELGVVSYIDGRGTRTRFSSPSFKALISTWFEGTALTKELPGWVFRLDTDLQLALLRGYLDADGSVSKRGAVSYSSISRKLIEGVRHLYIQLGIPVGRIGVNRARRLSIRGRGYQSCRESYSLRLSSVRHNFRIGSHSPHKSMNFTSVAFAMKSRYDSDWNSSVCRRQPMGVPPQNTIYHKVISVESSSIEVPVYDIEVKGLAHYVADGIIVHNTTAQRMNPRQAATMFFQHLGAYDWKNLDPGVACWDVQRAGNQTGYEGLIDAAIPLATQYVQQFRNATASPGSATTSTVAGSLPVQQATALVPSLSVPGTGGSNLPTSTPTISPAGFGAGGVPGGPGAVTGTRPYPDSESAISFAFAQIGKPYAASAGPEAFDCSGLLYAAFRAAGVDIGRDTWHQAAGNAVPIAPSAIQRGDALQTNGGDHTMLWLGNGMIIESSTWGQPIATRPAYCSPQAASGIFRYCANGGALPGNGAAPYNNPYINGGTGLTPSVIQASQSGFSSGAPGGGSEPIARNLFAYLFTPNLMSDPVARMYSSATPQKDFINAQPLIQAVASVTATGLRKFASAPNGDFIAYYPDFFGMDGKPAVFLMEDVELKDCSLNFSDDSLATHVYVNGSMTLAGQVDATYGWLYTMGYATVENEELYARMKQVSPGDLENLTGKTLMYRFGVRPIQSTYALAGTAELEFLLAVGIFMDKWSAQYQSSVGVTFMPDLFPGMRIIFTNHALQVYVQEVTHHFDFEHGFTTQLVVTAPSNPLVKNLWNAVGTTIPSITSTITKTLTA